VTVKLHVDVGVVAGLDMVVDAAAMVESVVVVVVICVVAGLDMVVDAAVEELVVVVSAKTKF